MDKLHKRKIALITGSSSGFGLAICARLLEDGFHVIACSRRTAPLSALNERYGNALLSVSIDVRHEESVRELMASLPHQWQDIDVLVNNAGVALGIEPAQEADFGEWRTMIDTNITGLALVTHTFLPHMVARKRGLIINIGSVAGKYPYPGGNVYGATKAFVAQFSLNLRADLAGTGVRVTDIQPGLCGGTEFSMIRFRGDQKKVKSLYAGANPLTPNDIAETVSWIASQPQHFNINSIEVMPTSQSFSALRVIREGSK